MVCWATQFKVFSMRKLVAFSIKNTFLVNLLSIFLMLIGAISLFHMKRDLISNWSIKQIEIQAQLESATPATVEKFVTYPIEQTIKNLPGIESIESTSSFGFSSITIKVRDDYKEIENLVQSMKDSVQNIRNTLPSDVEDIQVNQIKMSESWFSSYSVTGIDSKDNNHQKWLYKFKDKLQKVNGITRIQDSSNLSNIHIQFDPILLARYQLDLKNVYAIVQSSFSIYPLGQITKGSKNIYVDFKQDEVEVDDIANITIRPLSGGGSLHLKDIAKVFKKDNEIDEINFINSKEAVFLTLFKDLNSDTISLKEEVEKIVTEERKILPQGIDLILTGDGPSFIERQINALKSNAFFGVLLVIVTLMIFLGFKTSLMTSFGLPLSYLSTFFILENIGIKIDLISIVGMLLVLGILVDDAIVVAEQYIQNLENKMTPEEAAIEAVASSWMPILGAVLTTIVAFIPLLVAGDGLSDIMLAIPVVVISALTISVFESFFILPNHLVHFVKKAPENHESHFFQKLKAKYEHILLFFLNFKFVALFALIATFTFSLYFAYKNIPTNFNLNISSEKIKVTMVLNSASDLQDAKKQFAPLWQKLQNIDKSKINFFSMNIGSIWENGSLKSGPQYGNFNVLFSQLDDNVEENKKNVKKQIDEIIENFKKTEDFKKFLRINSQTNFDGINNDKSNIVEILVSSNAPFNVNEISDQIKSSLKGVKKIESVELDESEFTDSWTFIPNKKEIYNHGLSLSNLASQIRAYIGKSTLHENLSGPTPLKVLAYFEDSKDATVEDLANKKIVLNNGNLTRSKNLGSWHASQKEKSISHKNLKRIIKINVAINKEDTNKDFIIKEIEQKIKTIEEQYQFVTISTEDADIQSQKNKSAMLKNILLGIGLIYFILAVVLQSTIYPIYICSAIPFGMIGVIWAFYFQGMKIDVMSMIGIIAMAGVVVNDSLLLVDTINQKRGKRKFLKIDDIVSSCKERLRPVLLTSITTLGGVFPMAYGIGGDSGFTKPLAMSMGWGLLFSTCLTLLFLPSVLLASNIIKKKFYQLLKIKSELEITESEVELILNKENIFQSESNLSHKQLHNPIDNSKAKDSDSSLRQ